MERAPLPSSPAKVTAEGLRRLREGQAHAYRWEPMDCARSKQEVTTSATVSHPSVRMRCQVLSQNECKLCGWD
eukprot:scaffold25515_cov36-Tisochrysis_lutea.AAC.2